MGSDLDILMRVAAERDAHELEEHGLRVPKPDPTETGPQVFGGAR